MIRSVTDLESVTEKQVGSLKKFANDGPDEPFDFVDNNAKCTVCGKEYYSKMPVKAQYCSRKCANLAFRNKKKQELSTANRKA